jgi:GcrA cell cycle regulator
MSRNTSRATAAVDPLRGLVEDRHSAASDDQINEQAFERRLNEAQRRVGRLDERIVRTVATSTPGVIAQLQLLAATSPEGATVSCGGGPAADPQDTGEKSMEMTWTPGRVELLSQLFEEGLPTSEIGRRMGLTKNAVIGRLYRSTMTRRDAEPKLSRQRNFFEFIGSGCLWPQGHPDDGNFHFCGARPLPGKPYCADHAAIAYVRPKEEKRAA